MLLAHTLNSDLEVMFALKIDFDIFKGICDTCHFKQN